MTVNIRYRLIQILEILLWLGAVAGVGMVARDAWALREQGASAMLDAAGPGLLAIGAAMAALIVLIGIYHNSRRSAEAMDRLSRQGAGGMRRLPGAQRGADLPVQPAVPPAAPVAVTPAPVAPPVPVAAPVFSTPAPVVTEPEPASAPVTPHIVESAPADPRPEPQRLRAGIRRLGPAN
ncbi:hypothetical protein [Paracoccus xiamenensis]|uniref:hypothetical protein n=1 Tax=Paracoccus xiamenensis TaxID=2714901 RepID=UPI00140A9242|nr:hypothetical protein [Paracoccus xiamenensis]NHF73936.1 hypothetical protein [Paracoccus xiamenensis]